MPSPDCGCTAPGTCTDTAGSGCCTNSAGCYFCDSSIGLLFLQPQETEPNGNAKGASPSPLGNCPGGATCPDENFYSCPSEGCVDYTVEVHDDKYAPGPSTCTPYPATADSDCNAPVSDEDYTLCYPPNEVSSSKLNNLGYTADLSSTPPLTPIATTIVTTTSAGTFPHQTDNNAGTKLEKLCSVNEVAADVPPPPSSEAIGQFIPFQLTFPGGIIKIEAPGATIYASVPPINPVTIVMSAGQTYDFTFCASGAPACSGTGPCSCSVSLMIPAGATPSAPQYTNPSSQAMCGIGPGTVSSVGIAIGAGFTGSACP